MDYVHPVFRTVVQVGGLAVTGVLPGTRWRPEGAIQISGHELGLGRGVARELADALRQVADRMDAVADERYGPVAGMASIGEGVVC